MTLTPDSDSVLVKVTATMISVETGAYRTVCVRGQLAPLRHIL